MSDASDVEDHGPLTCAKCGCSSPLRSHFIRGKDGTVPRIWCPPCNALRQERLALWVMLGLSFTCVTGWFLSTRQPGDMVNLILVGFSVFQLAGIFMVIPHELGHALVAWLVGLPPFAIRIGNGHMIFNRYVLGVRVQLATTLHGGETLIEPRELANLGWRKIAVFAAGPAVNLIAALVALSMQSDTGLSPAARAALAGFGLSNLVLTVRNLWPTHIRVPSGRHANDGAQILAQLRGEERDHQTLAAGLHYYRAVFAYSDRDYAGTLREVEQVEALSKNSDLIAQAAVIRAEALSESGDARSAVQSLAPMRSRADLSDETRLALDGAHAWAAFMCDEPMLARDGLQYAQSCAMLMPWDCVLRIKHICLLSAFPNESTAVAEARRLADSLQSMRLEGESPAYGALARGMVAAAEGNRELARRELAKARRLRASAAALALLERRCLSMQSGKTADAPGGMST